MATIYRKHEVKVTAATDGTNYRNKVFQRGADNETAAATDDTATTGVAVLADEEAITLPVGDISIITLLFVNTTAICNVNVDAVGVISVNGDVLLEGAFANCTVTCNAAAGADVTWLLVGTE